MNTKKFVAIDSTIYYLHHLKKKKIESWIWKSGNLKMKFLKFKRRNLFENYINHYINAFHTRVIINNYNDSSIYLL